MHIALYREFRPAAFDQMIGQDHIVRILKNQIRTGNTSHAYLFSGTRGTGKTTTARILAKALNCTGEGEKPCCQCESCRAIAEGSYVDVIEMDAASNRSVHDIHDITDSAMYAPTAGRYKVYIIDEVHMLSTDAFNALLKTLEEPPEHVVFILATTEPQKVPATILSRCMKLDFRRVSERELTANMRRICELKQIDAEEAALSLIAVNADGSVRDSLSILEQCIRPGEPLRRDDVADVLGTAGVEPLLQLTDRILEQDASGALLLLNDILSAGSETRQFMKEWLEHFRNLLIARYVKDPSGLLNMSGENAGRVSEQSGRITQPVLERAIRELTETIAQTRWSSHPRVMLEMTIVRLATVEQADAPPVQERSHQPTRERGRNQGVSVPDSVAAQEPVVPENAMTPTPAPDRGSSPEVSAQRETRYPGIPERSAQEPVPLSDMLPRSEGRSRQEDPGFPRETGNLRQLPEQNRRELTAADWDHAVELASASKGLLIRLAGRTHFQKEEDGQVSILCDDETTAELLRGRGKDPVEKILERETGRHLNIIARVRGTEPAGQTDLRHKHKTELERYFGREVPVK